MKQNIIASKLVKIKFLLFQLVPFPSWVIAFQVQNLVKQ